VIAAIAAGADGETLNLNADTLAGELAHALGAEKMILLTDVEGVRDGQGALVSRLTESSARALIEDGTIAGGMIPKVECCLAALGERVPQAHIIDGRVKHAILLELFTDSGVGTLITADAPTAKAAGEPAP